MLFVQQQYVLHNHSRIRISVELAVESSCTCSKTTAIINFRSSEQIYAAKTKYNNIVIYITILKIFRELS